MCNVTETMVRMEIVPIYGIKGFFCFPVDLLMWKTLIGCCLTLMNYPLAGQNEVDVYLHNYNRKSWFLLFHSTRAGPKRLINKLTLFY